VHGALQARLRRIRYVGNESPEKWAAAVTDHEEMIAALEARDGARLAGSLSAHMSNTWDRVRDSM
jgi:DNA-binding GntR family transcriptional regulator